MGNNTDNTDDTMNQGTPVVTPPVGGGVGTGVTTPPVVSPTEPVMPTAPNMPVEPVTTPPTVGQTEPVEAPLQPPQPVSDMPGEETPAGTI